ncbi:alternate F1F0 ATPase, F1 subunit gamma [Desulfocapsa sulfexigens DSM 10523]|uniref:Alternate F1F0 ATPase, F1 subunit gamma n=1 Tax=Desulfocapsa sulfexigens (strain DSM 10523 / SB164P1) TaxID=1167006 RepID=M1NCS5_DESSD|nr:F0F1 ATP synthase subunit gamma [Desulfocapsa sulfexigens]AGF77544.1 alternate F1F0 ATPase, F1 subunit gamma [Desulfocapsa sulfexigens DSM 10523]
MSETLGNLRRKMSGAGKLGSVVRTMKALAASNRGQYENAVSALIDYDRTVELGLVAYFQQGAGLDYGVDQAEQIDKGVIGAIIFGSDQGLVGKFNEALVEFTMDALSALPGEKRIWAVGERVDVRLKDAGMPPVGTFVVPNSVTAITPLVGQILTEFEKHRRKGEIGQVYLFHNRPQSGALYESVNQRLLPLDKQWRHHLTEVSWPSDNLPDILAGGETTLSALIREYLFVSLFKACAESLAAENASRLAAMQRAEKNIDELLEDLSRTFHRLRQSTIDEELFDVVAGYELLSKEKK